MSADAEELDSGFEAISSPESPAVMAAASDNARVAVKQRSGRSALEDTTDDDDIEETLSERLWGLTEMFPQTVRTATSKLISGTVSWPSISTLNGPCVDDNRYHSPCVWIRAKRCTDVIRSEPNSSMRNRRLSDCRGFPPWFVRAYNRPELPCNICGVCRHFGST